MAKRKKKKSNPGIPPKKRKTRLETRRSNAAKRGWQTRRVNALIEAKAALARREKRAARKPKKAVIKKARKSAKPKGAVEKALRREIAELKKTIAEKWVKSEDDNMLHADGAIAIYPCRMRHNEFGRQVRKILLEAERKKGVRHMREQMQFYAENYNIPIQEFYTLIMSP